MQLSFGSGWRWLHCICMGRDLGAQNSRGHQGKNSNWRPLFLGPDLVLSLSLNVLLREKQNELDIDYI